MNFEYTDEQTDQEKLFGGHRHINAFGTINHGDADRLLKLINKARVSPSTTVYINSTGGDVEEAIKIGCVIRKYCLNTSIGTYILQPESHDTPAVPRELKQGSCISAATLIYVGGKLRHFPSASKFGVHRFSYRNPVPENVEKSQELSAGIAEYLQRMGVSLEFLSISASIASDNLMELSEQDLRKYNVVTGGQSDVVWTTQNSNSAMYVRGERNSIYGHHKVMLCFHPEIRFHFWGIIEAQGRSDELTNFRVVEIVVDGERLRIDVSDRIARLAINGYVNVIAKLTKSEAEALAHSSSFGVQIRYSIDSPIFLGISAMDTGPGRDQLINFFDMFRQSFA